jgi:hypothetical protein
VWRVYLLSGLIACACGTAAAVLTVQLSKPATSQASDADKVTTWGMRADGTVTQEGQETFHVTNKNLTPDKTVYYRRPFGSVPHLTLVGSETYNARITDQKVDCFKVQIFPENTFGELTIKWKAEGLPTK